MRSNIHVILVRPVFLGNIGSTARVLKNFGMGKLRLVAPPRNYKDAEARKMAVGAFEILKEAQVFETLSDALKDITLAIATTSAQQRDLFPERLPDGAPGFAQHALSNKIALVFGDERDGLNTAELQRCHRTITVPTDPAFPALNIVQAVAICLYELSKHLDGSCEAPPTVAYPSGAHDDEIFAQLDALLHSISFSRTYNREKILAELRMLYQKAAPTARESSLLKGALIRLNAKISG